MEISLTTVQNKFPTDHALDGITVCDRYVFVPSTNRSPNLAVVRTNHKANASLTVNVAAFGFRGKKFRATFDASGVTFTPARGNEATHTLDKGYLRMGVQNVPTFTNGDVVNVQRQGDKLVATIVGNTANPSSLVR